MTLNWESNIHFQPSTLTAMGSVNGITTSARTTRRPLNGWIKRNASAVPSSPFMMPAPSVKTTVLRTAVQNALFSSAALKFSRPTKRATGTPTEASLTARYRENTNGMPTSSAT